MEILFKENAKELQVGDIFFEECDEKFYQVVYIDSYDDDDEYGILDLSEATIIEQYDRLALIQRDFDIKTIISFKDIIITNKKGE